MTVATVGAPVAYITGFLETAELVDSTSAPGRASVVREKVVERSSVGFRPWASTLGAQHLVRDQTARSETANVLVGPERAADLLIACLLGFRDLEAGWDGEDAAKPSLDAIVDAVRFVGAAGELAAALEPTPHVDGSVLLEIDDGRAGALQFRGDGKVVYSLDGLGRGVAGFDAFTVPDDIRRALGA